MMEFDLTVTLGNILVALGIAGSIFTLCLSYHTRWKIVERKVNDTLPKIEKKLDSFGDSITRLETRIEGWMSRQGGSR